MIVVCVVDQWGCGLRIGGIFTKKTRMMSLCVGVLTCPKRYGCCAFKPTCLTLLRAYVQTRTCFCACQTVSWGKIISSVLSGSPRGLLCCRALLEPARREADMTAVLENEAKRTITPSASRFFFFFFFAAWYKHFCGAQEMKDTCRTTPKSSYCVLRSVVFSPRNYENYVEFFMQTNVIIH